MVMTEDERDACDDCPYCDDNGNCRSPIGCLNEGVTDEQADEPERMG